MKYYIASKLENAAQVRQLKAYLDDLGWEHTYDWTVHGSVQSEGVSRIAEVAANEAEGVLCANVVIVLLPGGRGTHTELGMAIGHWQVAEALQAAGLVTVENRRIIIYSDDPERDFGTNGTCCAFYHHPLVERVSSWTELLRKLVS